MPKHDENKSQTEEDGRHHGLTSFDLIVLRSVEGKYVSLWLGGIWENIIEGGSIKRRKTQFQKNCFYIYAEDCFSIVNL